MFSRGTSSGRDHTRFSDGENEAARTGASESSIACKIGRVASEGGTFTSFSQGQNLLLQTDADYGRFVDASITGPARERAIKLLELMPPGMRGDFVEIHPDGTITSNRADLPSKVTFQAHATNVSGGSRTVLHNSGIHAMSYPPTGGSGGPYIRLYSVQSINAAYGVATPPCDARLPNNNTGNMYFNAYDGNGLDIVDAGVGADEYPSHDGNTSDVFPFVNEPALGGWDPSQVSGTFINDYESWRCGTPLVIMYGTLPYPQYQAGGFGTSIFVAGVPDYDPAQRSLPPSTVTIQNPAWTFFYTPPALDSSPNAYDGIPSNCGPCSVALMFFIGESFADGGCYGICNDSNGLSVGDADWRNVVMGELISPCGPISFGLSNPCTLEYDSAASWYAGNNTCSGCDTSFGTDDGTNQHIVEGIADLSYYGQGTQTSIQVMSLDLPAAPSSPCTPDALSYCYVETAIAIGECGNPLLGNMTDYTARAYYDIFKMQQMAEFRESVTESFSMRPKTCIENPPSWSPNEPRSEYSDPSLP